MYKIIFELYKVSIMVNKAPSGFIPLWDLLLVAFKFSDIPKSVFNSLTEHQQISIAYFFEDVDFDKKLDNIIKNGNDSLEQYLDEVMPETIKEEMEEDEKI